MTSSLRHLIVALVFASAVLPTLACSAPTVGHDSAGSTTGITQESGELECVDSYGDNSTLEEIIRAARETASTELPSGRKLSQDDIAREIGNDTEIDRSEDFFANIPSGGDAAYSSDACALQYTWSLPTDTASHRDFLAQSPHYIRSEGRYLCKLFEGRELYSRTSQSGANIFYEGLRTAIGEMKANPDVAAATLESDISTAQQNGTALEATGLTESIENNRATIDWLKTLSVEQYLNYREQDLLQGQAAVAHLCPEFGPLDW